MLFLLWEYAFKDYDANRLPRYLLEMYSFIVDSCEASPEELGNHIQYIQGEIYYTSPSDNCFAETKNDEYRSFFAVLNGKDTLQLNIRDTIGQHLLFKSVDNAAFFQSLPKNDTWYKLYDLLRDSTFYFQNQKGSFIRYSIPFNPACWRFSVNGMCGQGCYDLYKRGVKVSLKDLDSYDKWNVD